LKCKFEVVAGPCVACYLKRAHCVCDIIIALISCGIFPTFAAIFLLALDDTLQLATVTRLYLTAAMCEGLYNCRMLKCLKKS